MFQKDGDFKKQTFQIINNEGEEILPGGTAKPEPEIIRQSFENMLFSRFLDRMLVSFQRQGRIFTYPLNFGQEAINEALSRVLEDQDWFVPSFRELGTWLGRGVSIRDIFLYFKGYEEGGVFAGAPRITPLTIPIGSQLNHGTGLAYALRYRKEKGLVFSVVGDGGTSTGDFHTALNFASVWKVPIVFLVINNQYAISVPVEKQHNASSIAVKSAAYGIPGIPVDGNDFLAVHEVLREAKSFAAETGPVLIEALTYRKGAHTTSDDPSKYRSEEEEQSWEAADPIRRMRKYLRVRNLYTEKEEEEFKNGSLKKIEKELLRAEQHPPYPLADVFDHLYEEKPEALNRQQREFEDFLRWKEASGSLPSSKTQKGGGA